jgi:hypothetical protein
LSDGDHIIPASGNLDAYCQDLDLVDKGKATGKNFTFNMPLVDSKLFADAVRPKTRYGNPYQEHAKERPIYVHVPDAYRDGDRAPILVQQEGSMDSELYILMHAGPSRHARAATAAAAAAAATACMHACRHIEH